MCGNQVHLSLKMKYSVLCTAFALAIWTGVHAAQDCGRGTKVRILGHILFDPDNLDNLHPTAPAHAILALLFFPSLL